MKMTAIDKSILIAVLLISGLNFFNYLPLRNVVLINQGLLFLFFFIVVRVSNFQKVINKSYFGKYIALIIISYGISAFFSIFFWHQTIFQSIYMNLAQVAILAFYYLLIFFKVREKDICLLFVYLTILWTTIEWIQQLTYPNILFCGRINEGVSEIENRMGLWRFYISGIHIAVFILLIYASKIINNDRNRIMTFFIFSITLLGIFGYLSRKHIYTSLLCLFLTFLFAKGERKYITWSIICLILIFGGLDFFLNIMVDLNSQTVSELNSDTFIRFIATDFFLHDFSHSPIYYLWGTGKVHAASSLGEVFMDLQETYHFFIVDCGIVGFFVQYGVVGCVLFILPIIIIIKNWKLLMVWHKTYLIFNISMFPFAFWGNSVLGTFSYIIFLYVVGIHLTKMKKLSIQRIYSE